MSKISSRLNCFSPPAMMATFLIESGLAIYIVVRYKMSNLVRISAAILTSLAIFQLAEFNVCGTTSSTAMAWSRIGYMAIAILPPLGLHLILTIAQSKARILQWIAYATSLLFVATFGFSTTAFAGHVCAGNYAIFQLVHPVGGIFFAYYYAWIFIGIGLSLYFSIKANQRVREALILQVIGYLSFMLPTGVVNAINPNTIVGIPSVMCGFAVIYAVILAIGIVPISLGEQSLIKAKHL